MYQPDGTNAVLAAGQALELDQPSDFVRHRGGRSPRQQRLDKLWAFYDCEQYAARKVAWDGTKHVGQFERDTVAIAGYVPPGFYVAGNDTIPLAFRRPTTPYHLARVVVDRFTSLLFSQRRHPKMTVDGDTDTDAMLNAIIEQGRLWPTMMQVRMFGGATGTGVVGLKFIDGVPKFEIFDPRWTTPRWLDRPNLILRSIEYRYPYMEEMKVDGKWQEVEVWYRRVITKDVDAVFKPEIIMEGEDRQPIEPVWEVAEVVQHKLGFCPVTWIQNIPNATDIDGYPDCHGIFEMTETIDKLLAQTDGALLANLDPTLAIFTDAENVGSIKTGSDNTLRLRKGEEAKYLEIAAEGIKAGRAAANEYRDYALEVSQCVLERPGTVQRTATEVERAYSSMFAKADILREQYCEFGVKRLLNMAIVAIKTLTEPKVSGNTVTRGKLALPKRVTHTDTGPQLSEHKLGPGPYAMSMAWPAYFEPSAEDTQKAAGAAITAKVGGLIDSETATRYVAANFGVEDIKGTMQKVAKERDDGQAEAEAAAVRGPTAAVKELVKDDEGV